ncbi:MlaA family lipoprotein [Nioella nitratireducens]|uniref:MlaA family lipoprotein n=1 Tax=Nioella nitratireducens TaxID=1287720 RepID=UPI0038993317
MVLGGLTACGPAVLPGEGVIEDPTEDANRAMYDFNVAVDRALVRPVSQGYGTVVPEPVRNGVRNFSSNLDQPLMVVNDVLQLQFADAFQNTFRFLVNSTFGLAGLLDPATDMGIYAADTDFGETMHVWGVSEGGYVVLPILGPSTSRDTVGLIVDAAMNPTRLAFSTPESDYVTGTNVGDALDTRYRYTNEVDRLYYESVDGYSQARSLYLQNRRYELRGSAQAEYFDPYSDPYSDPYEDPYAN